MPSTSEIATAAPWLFPSTLSLVGVLIGSALTLHTQQRMAKRTHRRELALSALEAVTKARGAVSAARLRTRLYSVPLYETRAATEIWARFEMLAALEKRKKDYRPLSACGMTTHEWLMAGAQTSDELEQLGAELRRLSVLLVAWERRKAKGRHFRLGLAEAFSRFGPDFTDADLPPS